MGDARIAITGSGGRMGRMLVAEIQGTPGCVVSGGTETPNNPLIGRDLGELAGLGTLGVTASGDREAVFAQADAVVDFTSAAASVEHAQLAASLKKPLVIGTTGLDDAMAAAVREAAKHAPIVWAANMSLGVNLLLGLVEQVAGILGEDYDIELVEMHHKHKVDAPSGTALALGRAAAAGRAIDLAKRSQRVRDGHTGPRKAGDIGFATLRGGDVVGDHTVVFAGAGERIELTHKAASRQIYARGSIRAALWAIGKPPGLYGMKEVLGL